MRKEDICEYLVANDSSKFRLLNASNFSEWDQDLYRTYSLWINGIIMTLVIIGGLFGNVATCYVLLLKPMRAKINRYVIALACWDSIVLMTCWILFSFGALQHGELPSYGNEVYNYMIFYPVSNIAKTASIWTLLLTSCERYLAISNPLHQQRLSTPLRFRMILVLTGLGASLFNITKFFEITVICCPVGSEVVPTIVTTDLRENYTYFIAYHIVLNLLLISLGPFCVQAILTTLISYHLRHSMKYRKKHSSFYVQRHPLRKRQTLETSMNLMFVMVCTKFLICLILPTCVNVAEIILKMRDKEQISANGPFAFLVDVSNLMAVTNSALNFPIYVAFCDRFRKVFLMSVKCRHAATNPSNPNLALPPERKRGKERRKLSLPSLNALYVNGNGNSTSREFRIFSAQIERSPTDSEEMKIFAEIV